VVRFDLIYVVDVPPLVLNSRIVVVRLLTLARGAQPLRRLPGGYGNRGLLLELYKKLRGPQANTLLGSACNFHPGLRGGPPALEGGYPRVARVILFVFIGHTLFLDVRVEFLAGAYLYIILSRVTR
jgi:hypothetical protein